MDWSGHQVSRLIGSWIMLRPRRRIIRCDQWRNITKYGALCQWINIISYIRYKIRCGRLSKSMVKCCSCLNSFTRQGRFLLRKARYGFEHDAFKRALRRRDPRADSDCCTARSRACSCSSWNQANGDRAKPSPASRNSRSASASARVRCARRSTRVAAENLLLRRQGQGHLRRFADPYVPSFVFCAWCPCPAASSRPKTCPSNAGRPRLDRKLRACWN